MLSGLDTNEPNFKGLEPIKSTSSVRQRLEEVKKLLTCDVVYGARRTVVEVGLTGTKKILGDIIDFVNEPFSNPGPGFTHNLVDIGWPGNIGAVLMAIDSGGGGGVKQGTLSVRSIRYALVGVVSSVA